jgi:GT2 family glycosyltransferase
VYGRDVVLAANCIESVRERSTYENYEIIAVVDESTRPDALEAIEAAGGDALRIVPFTKRFNFAEKINVGSAYAKGDHLLLLNDDTEVETPDWIESLLMYSRQEGIGAVGPRLLFGDGRIQHAGIVSTRYGPSHCFYGFRNDYVGYFSAARIPTNYLAVTAACMMTRRGPFEMVGGLCTDFPSSYNDVDYCYKLHAHGFRIAYNPEVTLFHYESSSRSPHIDDADYALLRRRWAHYLDHDPYNNPNFFGANANFIHRLWQEDGTMLPA